MIGRADHPANVRAGLMRYVRMYGRATGANPFDSGNLVTDLSELRNLLMRNVSVVTGLRLYMMVIIV
jgi:hypothetical protein